MRAPELRIPDDGGAGPTIEEAVRLGIDLELIRNTAPFNTYGFPTISIPCGFTKSGPPIGLQISGPHFGEAEVLALAHAYEQATDWHTRRPRPSVTCSWFPQRIRQVNIEPSRAQDLPNGILPDARCDPTSLIGDLVSCSGDDCTSRPEGLRVDFVERVARLVMDLSILRGVHPQLQRGDAFEQEWTFI
jgi:hypothetical protein